MSYDIFFPRGVEAFAGVGEEEGFVGVGEEEGLAGGGEEEIYMKQLDGFHVEGKEDYVCRLRKSLYGLKQAPR